ncbi:MAG: hypothetical protein GWN58_27485 [Anaerolineae bacterium]|nr:hypothetical protein [Anaerolineae bacterium]
MIVKSAIAAHVALLKKNAAAAMPAPAAQETDPNQEAIQAAKDEAARKKALADIAVERSNAELATSKAAQTVQQNQAEKEQLEAEQAQQMPAPEAGVGAAPTTPGMPNMQQPPAPTMPQATISPGAWGMQPFRTQQMGGQ